MPDFTIASQDEILTAAGVQATGPSAATVAQRIATDHVVLEKASQLAAQHFITQAVESLSPQERERLIKRTADQNAPKPQTTTGYPLCG
jgi:uncharacterized membrane protein